VRPVFLLLTLILAAPAAGQIVTKAQGWSPLDEMEDFRVAPRAELRLNDHAAPTPLTIPGARLITTAELQALLAPRAKSLPVLVDVMGDGRHLSIHAPGAVWLPGAGRGSSFDDELQTRLAAALQRATGGHSSRTLIFFCANPRCWLSYNAALRAVRLGYSDVRWYRGGVHAWGVAGGNLSETRDPWPARRP
jgi:PQQ-dependent catabolism-associated CXXCW motif protein